MISRLCTSMRLSLPALWGTILLASCETLPTDGPLPNGIEASVASVAQSQDRQRPQEALFRRVADEAPDFGGAFLDESGALVAWITAPQSRGAVTAALTRAMRDFIPDQTVPAMLFRSGEYSFDELATWRDNLTDPLMAIDEVISLDVDERRNRIVVGVANLALRTAVRDEINALDIPLASVLFEQREPVANLVGRGRRLPSTTIAKHLTPRVVRRNHTLRSSFINGLLGGIQIGYFDHTGEAWACTLGFVATAGASVRFVTNSHCSDDKWTLDFTDYYQPSANLQQPVIGAESIDPGADPCGFLNLANCRYSDANVVSLTNGFLGRIARPENQATFPALVGSIDVDQGNPHFLIAGPQTQPVFVGTQLSKVGRTTGWTTGDVTETCVTIKQAFLTLSHHLCQHKVEAGADNGDSGAPVFYERPDGTVFLQGVLWGGPALSGIYWMSPLSGVLTDLGSMQWWAIFVAPPLTVSISGPSTVSPLSFGPWDASVSGGVPPFTYQWSGVLSGSGPTVWGPVSSSGWLYLEVTDSGNPPQSKNAQKFITVDGGCPPMGC